MYLNSYLNGQCRSNEAGMVAECSHSPTGAVLKKLEIIQSATSPRESGQGMFPATLLLVAMGKVYESVLERGVFFWEFLQANDYAVGWGRLPRAFVDQGAANVLELLVLEDTGVIGVFGTALDEHGVACVEQLLGCGGSETGTVFEGLGLSASVESWERHFVAIEGDEMSGRRAIER